MTAPYRLRDVFGNRGASFALAGTVGSAVMLGLAPSIIEIHSLGPALMLVYVALSMTLLLVNMHTTDRRLREVSAS